MCAGTGDDFNAENRVWRVRAGSPETTQRFQIADPISVHVWSLCCFVERALSRPFNSRKTVAAFFDSERQRRVRYPNRSWHILYRYVSMSGYKIFADYNPQISASISLRFVSFFSQFTSSLLSDKIIFLPEYDTIKFSTIIRKNTLDFIRSPLSLKKLFLKSSRSPLCQWNKKKLIVRRRKGTWRWTRLVNSCTMAEIYRVVICKADRMYPAGGESGSQGVISGTKAGAATSGTKLVENW